MRKELAKLCLDLVKYILTAIIISGLFSGLENNWAIYITAILLICFLTVVSYFLFNNNQNKSNYVSTNPSIFRWSWHYCRMGSLLNSPRQQEGERGSKKSI